DIRSLLDPPTRLELKSFDPGLEQKIVDQVDHKLTIADEKLKLVDEKTRATQYPLNLIDEKLKSVESFAKGLSLATAFVGLFSFWGGAYTGWKLGELNQRSGQLEAALTNSEIAASHNRQLMIETNIDELGDFMEKFSVSSPDPSLLERAERRSELLRRASKTVDFSTPAGRGDALILKLITKSYESVQPFKLAKSRDQKEALNDAERKLIEMADILDSDTAKEMDKRYPEMIRKIKAYRENLLGIIFLWKYRFLD